MDKTKLAFSLIPSEDYTYPVLQEGKNGNIILYGLNNEYPYVILNLYKKSAKHMAIINAKCQYIYGNGWELKGNKSLLAKAKLDQFLINPNTYDDLSDVTQKAILDMEIYNGFGLAVTWAKDGTISFIEHVPFEKIRQTIDGDFYQIADWYDERMIRLSMSSGKMEKIPKFNPSNRIGKQLYYHRIYTPGVKTYPLPGYEAAIPYIECDAEIAKFHINNIRNQFWGGMMINFNDGIPTEEEKYEIERQLRNKFSGAKNAGRFVLSFSNSKENAPSVQALTPSDLDKQFDLLNKQIQQEIFVAHNVVSPMLFGIRVESQLGGRSEMLDAYELFKNTYIHSRQIILESCFNYLASFNDINDMQLVDAQPINQAFTETILSQIMTTEELRDKLGLPKIIKKTANEETLNAINILSPLIANKVLESMDINEIRSLAALQPMKNIDTNNAQNEDEINVAAAQVNEAIRGLSGRQYQNLMRIIRHHSQGKISDDQARLIIGSGYGLNDVQIDGLLGIKEQQFSTDDDDDDFELLRQIGKYHGHNLTECEVLNERPIELCYEDLEESEREFRSFHFAELSEEEKKWDEQIIKYRKKNPEATTKEMAKDLDIPIAKLKERIQYLLDNNKYPIKEAIGDKAKEAEEPMVYTMYKYAWRPEYRNLSEEDGYDRSRKFCQVMMDLAETKLYSRKDIDAISTLVGYSVWERRGGWFTLPDGRHRPSCRHMWLQQLVIKKDGEISRVNQFASNGFADSFSDYGDDVRNNAKKGIELNEKNGNQCATQTGKVRARQLANGEAISVETIKRMYSYLSRAEVYYDQANSNSDCGYISYLLWGGKSGLSWAKNKLRELGELKEE